MNNEAENETSVPVTEKLKGTPMTEPIERDVIIYDGNGHLAQMPDYVTTPHPILMAALHKTKQERKDEEN